MNLLLVKCLRINHLIIFLLVLFCVSVKALDPQKRITQYDIKIYRSSDGLPMNTLNFVVPGPDGYIWIGSQEGLVRFDGKRFVSVDDIYGTQISGHSVTAMAVDKRGNYWLLSPGMGVYIINGRNVIFDKQPFPPDSRFLFLSEDIKHIIGNGSLYQWTGNHFEISNKYGIDNTTRLNNIVDDDKGNTYFIETNGALKIWNGATVVEISTDAPLISFHKFPSGDIICKSTNRKFYVIENQHLKPYRFDKYSPQTDWTSNLFDATYYSEDKEKNLWFLTNQYGIGRLNRGKLEYLTAGKGLPGDNMSFVNIGEDHEGNLWAASGMGLIKISETKFSAFGLTEGIHGGGSSICADDEGNVWSGLTDHIVDKYDGTRFVGQKAYQKIVDLAKNSIFPSEDGVWIGLRSEKLAHYSYGDVEIFDLPKYATSNINDEYRWSQPLTIATDDNNTVWTGTTFGKILAFTDRQFSNIISLDRKYHIRSLLKSRDGDIWVGGDGPTLGKIVNNEFVPVENIDMNDRLFPESVLALYEDADGVLWAGTEYRGLIRMENDKTTWFSTRDALYSDRIYSVLEDNSGRLWFSSNKGIFCVEKQQLNRIAATGQREPLNCRVFNHLDGMRQAECNGRRQPVAWKAPDGRFWYVTVIGAVSIHPDSFYTNPVPPPVYVERFITNGQPGRFILPGENEMQLSAHHRDLEIEYTALSFSVPERVSFKYQLEGYDNNWIDAGNRRSAFYTNLPRGEYTFRVKACNNDGIWNETGAAITFTIPPFWFETWWAKSIFGILAMSALVLASRMYIRKNLDRQHMRLKAEQATRLEQLDGMKTRFFANISHEFRTPLTLILGPLEQFLAGKISQNPENDYRIMHRNARRLQGLINQLLDLSKLDAGGLKLQAQPTAIGQSLKTLCHSFLSHAEQLGVQLHLNIPETVQVVYLDREKFEKILTNILSNTFKFTPKGGVVQVLLRQHLPSADDSDSDVSFVEIEISDTGIGISPEQLPHIFDRFYQADGGQTRVQEGSGIGLALARELVELHHGDIRVASEPGKGTTFSIKLPTGKSHLQDEEIISEDLPEGHDFQPTVRDIFAAEKVAASSTTHPVVSESAPLVLIVEDNADLRYYLRSRLSDNYRIAEAENGEKGVALAQESMPDLVISDVMMPVMDGFELCRRLKTDERTCHIPVILLTALASPENKLEGLENRADDYIVKPFDAGELRVRVRNLIENREMLRQRFRTESGIQPANVTVTRHDEAFLKKALSLVEKHLANQRFSLDDFAGEMAWSAKTLQRKIKALTGFTAHEFIYDIRLKTAAQLLRESDETVTTIAIDTGFSSPGHLAKLFRKRFGMSPSVYRSVNTPT